MTILMRSMQLIPLLLMVASAAPVSAEENTLKEGAREIGHAVGTAAKEVGEGAKKVGKAVGKAAKEGAEAIKEGVKEAKQEMKKDE